MTIKQESKIKSEEQVHEQFINNSACVNKELCLFEINMTEEKINSSSSARKISLPSLNNQGMTEKENLSACCNVKRYQIRRVKNKGAVLVLAISYLVTNILYGPSKLCS